METPWFSFNFFILPVKRRSSLDLLELCIPFWSHLFMFSSSLIFFSSLIAWLFFRLSQLWRCCLWHPSLCRGEGSIQGCFRSLSKNPVVYFYLWLFGIVTFVIIFFIYFSYCFYPSPGPLDRVWAFFLGSPLEILFQNDVHWILVRQDCNALQDVESLYIDLNSSLDFFDN